MKMVDAYNFSPIQIIYQPEGRKNMKLENI